MTGEGASRNVSLLLEAVGRGEPGAADRLVTLVYEELRRLARSQLARRPRVPTLQTNTLVHEAYLRLFKNDEPGWQGRRHFFASAAKAMRQILVDRARKRTAKKRHWGQRISLSDNLPEDARSIEILALDEVLEQLADEYPRHAEVVKLRYFLGLTVPEIARLLEVSPRTVESDWHLAKAWLSRAMGRA